MELQSEWKLLSLKSVEGLIHFDGFAYWGKILVLSYQNSLRKKTYELDEEASKVETSHVETLYIYKIRH